MRCAPLHTSCRRADRAGKVGRKSHKYTETAMRATSFHSRELTTAHLWHTGDISAPCRGAHGHAAVGCGGRRPQGALRSPAAGPDRGRQACGGGAAGGAAGAPREAGQRARHAPQRAAVGAPVDIPAHARDGDHRGPVRRRFSALLCNKTAFQTGATCPHAEVQLLFATVSCCFIVPYMYSYNRSGSIYKGNLPRGGSGSFRHSSVHCSAARRDCSI